MANLTKTEEQVMKYLWKLGTAFMKDLVDEYPKPQPAYTTIATILTRMIDKGYVGYHQHGKVREYYPILKKPEYFKNHLKDLMKTFFNNSYSQFASFFASQADLSVEELEELKTLIEDRIKQKRK